MTTCVRLRHSTQNCLLLTQANAIFDEDSNSSVEIYMYIELVCSSEQQLKAVAANGNINDKDKMSVSDMFEN